MEDLLAVAQKPEPGAFQVPCRLGDRRQPDGRRLMWGDFAPQPVQFLERSFDHE